MTEDRTRRKPGAGAPLVAFGITALLAWSFTSNWLVTLVLPTAIAVAIFVRQVLRWTEPDGRWLDESRHQEWDR